MKQRTGDSTDRRELAAYTLAEAAHYLALPKSTVRYWTVGRQHYRGLIQTPSRSPLLLSFLNLVELHVLTAIRREHAVTLPTVRRALRYIEQEFGTAHPLISQRLETDGLDLFLEHYGQLINISRDGQLAMRDVLKTALRRIERDARGLPVKLYPFTRTDVTRAPRFIVINPVVAGGRPVLVGTGVATEAIAERYKAGESIEDLAQDYERPEEEIQEAIRCELQAAA